MKRTVLRAAVVGAFALIPAAAVAQAAGGDSTAVLVSGGAGLLGSVIGGLVGGWVSAERKVRERWKADTIEATREEMDSRLRSHELACPLRNGSLRVEVTK
jgi:hypothetical protein